MMLQLHLVAHGASLCQTASEVQHAQACTQRCALFGSSAEPQPGGQCRASTRPSAALSVHSSEVPCLGAVHISHQQGTFPASTLHCRLVTYPPHWATCAATGLSTSPVHLLLMQAATPAGHATAGQHTIAAPSALLQDTPSAQASPVDALLQRQQCQGNAASCGASPAILFCCRSSDQPSPSGRRGAQSAASRGADHRRWHQGGASAADIVESGQN